MRIISLVLLFLVLPDAFAPPGKPADVFPVDAGCFTTYIDINGHLRVFIPGYAFPDPLPRPFYLQARLVGERSLETRTYYCRLITGGYLLLTNAGLSLDEKERLLADGDLVAAFHVMVPDS